MPLGREAIHPLTIRAVLVAVQSPPKALSAVRDELHSDLEGAGLKTAAIRKNLETFDNLVKSTKAGAKMAVKRKSSKRKMNPAQSRGLAKGQSLMAKAAAEYRAGKHRTMQAALKAVAKKSR
jgi:hypothetical protein